MVSLSFERDERDNRDNNKDDKDDRNREKFITRLFSWHKQHYQKFSFRNASDPFHILISEMLLRQTRGRQVDKIFPLLIALYPTPQALAKANIRDIENIIKPLGMRGRARQIIEVSRIIAEKFKGSVPNDWDSLLSLPGIGKYIAGCVKAFAFNEIVPLIDVNVKRVLSRVFGVNPKNEKALCQLYLTLSPRKNIREFHYALLDLAALICKSKNPRCLKCPVKDICEYSRKNCFLF